MLVSDFDGTMTRYDFYKLAIADLLPSGTPDYWAAFRAGEITHFRALQQYFAAIRSSEADVLAVVERMELDPHLSEAVAALHAAGWRVVIASAGCDWYIRHLLRNARVDIEVHANPGRFEAGRGLLMRMPAGAPYWSPTLGIDKAAIVRDYMTRGLTVAFAGDGFPDAQPAMMVPADRRFARGDLAGVLAAAASPFVTFDWWSSIAEHLIPASA